MPSQSIRRIAVAYGTHDETGGPGSTNIVKPVYHVAWIASRLGLRVTRPLEPIASPAAARNRAAVNQLDLGVTIKGLAIGLRRSIPQDSHLSLEIGRRIRRPHRFRALALNLPFPDREDAITERNHDRQMAKLTQRGKTPALQGAAWYDGALVPKGMP